MVQGLDDPFRRLGELQALEPYLEGPARREALDTMVRLATEQGSWSWSPDWWDVIPDAGIPGLVERLVRKDASGWNRDALVDHVFRQRSPEVAERAFLPVIRTLRRLRADRCLEAVAALTPWLADRTGGAFPRGVAGLEVPVPRRKADRWRRMKRMLRAG